MTTPGIPATAKGRRISLQWLIGAVLALVLLIVDWITAVEIPEAIVSISTTIVLGLALFYDVKAGDEGFDVFDPSKQNGG